MDKNIQKAILVVSFGTSYAETRRKTLDRIEADFAGAYPDYRIYRAWTSGMIRRKVEKRDGVRIPGVKEALEQMAADGVREVLVQPTHVLNGVENERMKEDIQGCQRLFSRIIAGAPLLTTQEDSLRLAHVIIQEFRPVQDEMLVLMGHGTEHYANSVYAAFNYLFQDLGYPNILMGTVEAWPDFASVLRRVQERKPARILLAPFMIVAGDHAENDLAGGGPDSWKSRFGQAGYEVACIRKGLGEYEGVRQMLLAHAAAAMRGEMTQVPENESKAH